ncbi:MAG: hypothetical protein ABL904_15440, partial [Hyphomicrobiaceae bacterium]
KSNPVHHSFFISQTKCYDLIVGSAVGPRRSWIDKTPGCPAFTSAQKSRCRIVSVVAIGNIRFVI